MAAVMRPKTDAVYNRNMESKDPLRQQLIHLLTKAEAHVDIGSALKDFPRELRASKPHGSPHTPWQLLEHLRIAQSDIVQFTLNPKHRSPKFPDGYWPRTDAPADDRAWDKSVANILAELDEMVALVADPKIDLMKKIPHGTGQTYLREALLLSDHNSYHVGQIVMLRRIMEGK
jgi:DinB superfamily